MSGGRLICTPRQVDVAAAEPSTPGCKNLAVDPPVELFQDEEPHHAVIDQHDVADGNVVDEALVVHIDGIFFLALRAADGELENVPRL